MHIREIQQKDDAALFQLVQQSLVAAQLNIPGTAYFDEAKGKGYSYKLMELVEQEAKKVGYKQLYLETHSNLPIAIILYKKLGYTQIPAALPGTQHTTMDHFFVKKL